MPKAKSMGSNDVVYPIVIILMVLLPIIISIVDSNGIKNEIRHDLLKQGATNIDILRDWVCSDWSKITFDVNYTDVQGIRQTARCQLKCLGGLTYGNIIWLEPRGLELTQIAAKQSCAQSDERNEEIRSNQ